MFANDKLLQDNMKSTDASHLVTIVNSVCLSSLRKLSYEEKLALIKNIAKQETLKEYSELAILRLMNALHSRDYKTFYQDLELGDNALLKQLVKEIDDASLYFWTDQNNYTNFIGALVSMFTIAPESYADRFAEVDTEQLLGQVINLNPLPFVADKPTSQSPLIRPLNEFRFVGVYNQAKGTISIHRENKYLPINSEGSMSTTHLGKRRRIPIERCQPTNAHYNHIRQQPAPCQYSPRRQRSSQQYLHCTSHLHEVQRR
ncbi:MAG: hypothetical protein RL662_1125 [Bacteroidota bacterium]|jgi:hypothetical protein